MNKIFKICDFIFEVNYPKELPVPEFFMLFEILDGKPEYTYKIQFSEEFPTKEGKGLANRSDIKVFQTNIGENRLIRIKNENEYYAYYQEVSETAAEIYLKPEMMSLYNIDPVFTSLFAFERRLLKREALVLHCAYVKDRGGAILFSAPSETGKTTQANLWEKYRGSKTINGDRAVIQKVNGKWYAHGWPVCGTSEVCNNISMPIKAIVMLSQAKENQVRKMKGREAFISLYSQITINQWNIPACQKAVDLIENILEEIPIYHLGCTISEKAVECLEHVL